MSKLQKEILWQLLQGGTIATYRDGSYRLRDGNGNPVMKFHYQTFSLIKHLLRKRKDALFVIDKNEIRKLSGHSWMKKATN